MSKKNPITDLLDDYVILPRELLLRAQSRLAVIIHSVHTGLADCEKFYSDPKEAMEDLLPIIDSEMDCFLGLIAYDPEYPTNPEVLDHYKIKNEDLMPPVLIA